MMLGGRLRFPDVPYTQLAGATNPADPKHWLIRRFREEGKGELLQAATTDNRFLPPTTSSASRATRASTASATSRASGSASRGGLFDPAWIISTQPQSRRAPAHRRRGRSCRDRGQGQRRDGHRRGGQRPHRAWLRPRRPVGAHGPTCGPSASSAPTTSSRPTASSARSTTAAISSAGTSASSTRWCRTTRVVASRGKITRAEPIANLYGIGKVSHGADFPELVSQMIGYDGKGSSPDRMDALVWALTDLMLDNPWAATARTTRRHGRRTASDVPRG
jgi:hypothetical protein